MVVHMLRPHPNDRTKTLACRLCDGGPAVDLPDPKAAIKDWKTRGYKVGDDVASKIRWFSGILPDLVTCEECRSHPDFADIVAHPIGQKLDAGPMA
jgi:hypothetical protein